MYLALVDQYEQVVGVDSTSKISVFINQTFSSSKEANVYPPVLVGSSQFYVTGGVVEVNDIEFTASPGYNYSLVITTDGIDETKKSNQIYMNSSNLAYIDFDVYVQLRECAIGEQFKASGACEMCANGTSFSLIQMK